MTTEYLDTMTDDAKVITKNRKTTDKNGDVVVGANSQDYNRMAPMANKVIHPDGTVTTLEALYAKEKEGLVIPEYDEVVLSYVSAGNGVGEIETVEYKKALSRVCLMTLSYDASNNLISVTKS